jgi:hypothetical protein
VCCTEEVTLCSTHNSPALHNLDGLQVWSPESGTRYFTPEDGHKCSKNVESINQHFVASSWFLSYITSTMHGHTNIKFHTEVVEKIKQHI